MPDQKPEAPEGHSKKEETKQLPEKLSTLEVVARVTAIIEMLAALQVSRYSINKLGAFPKYVQGKKGLTYVDFYEEIDSVQKENAATTIRAGEEAQTCEAVRFIDWFIEQKLEECELDKLLPVLAPEEKLFKKSLREQIKEDPACLGRIFIRLADLRRERGVCILPVKDYADTSEIAELDKQIPDPRGGKISGIENLTRIETVFSVLATFEEFFQDGALPERTFAAVAAHLMYKYELDKYLSVFLPTSDWVKDGKVPAFKEPLKDRIAKELWCFSTTFNRLAVAAKELFPVFGLHFVDDFFETFAMPDAKSKAQSVLSLLEKRLGARKRAIEDMDYDLVKTVDTNLAEIFNTLKQYGINASSYHDALQQYHKIYEAKPPEKPVFDEAAVEREIEAELKKRISIDDVGVRMTEKYPKHADFIKRYIDRRHNPKGF